MNNQPLFSILIANYNNGRYLGQALDSIYHQSYQNWEIIIVDDQSTDCSLEIYKKIKDNNRIKIYYNDSNKGAGFTKRKCVEKASGDICAFLDPDDALTDDALEKMINAHRDKPEISLVHSTSYHCDENLKVIKTNDAPKQIIANDPYFLNMESAISHFASFKRSFYQNTEGIDPYLQRAVDQDLYLKLYDVGETYFLNEVLYYYRIHNSGISTNKNVGKAYFWHWIVIINTGKRRGTNYEDLFCNSLAPKFEYDKLENRYLKLRKYEKLNNLLGSIRRKF
jgi:glycosyltransferase involved in cell wall biosynthesis